MGGGTTSGVKNDGFSLNIYWCCRVELRNCVKGRDMRRSMFQECTIIFEPIDMEVLSASRFLMDCMGQPTTDTHRHSAKKVRLWQGSIRARCCVVFSYFFLMWFCSMLNVFKYTMIHSSLLFMRDRFVEMPTLWFHRYDFDGDTIWNGDGIQIWESLPLQFLYFQDLRSYMMEGPLSVFLQPHPSVCLKMMGKQVENIVFSVK